MIDDNFNEDEINIKLWNVETDKLEYAHSLEDILENVNRGRNDECTDYDHSLQHVYHL
jgi:hypothetical protein